MLGALARRFGFAYRLPGRVSAPRRLSISEIMPVDSRRRLLLVRRDGVEHLILLGTGTSSDLLVESNIAATDGGFAVALAAARQSGGSLPADRPPS